MRGFRKAIEVRLDQRITTEFPKFEFRKYEDIPPVKSYCCRAGDALWFHMVPNIDFGRHWFTMELSFMKTERSPIYARIGLPTDKPNEDGLRFSVTHLWVRNAPGWVVAIEELDFSWQNGDFRMRPAQLDDWIANHQEIYPDSISDVERLTWPLVDDLIVKLHSYAIPYFVNVASEFGGEWRAD